VYSESIDAHLLSEERKELANAQLTVAVAVEARDESSHIL
jgi:hypothetical protein